MSSFFTRPDLDDRQFKQNPDSELTLSGATDFIGTLKTKNVEIDGTVSSFTTQSGYTLSLIDGKIQLAKPIAETIFDGNRAITQKATKPSDAGNVGGETLGDFIENFFYPPEEPLISLVINGGTSRQFGNSTVDDINWSVTKKTFPITIITVNINTITPTGISQSGVVSYTVTPSKHSPAFVSTQATESYSMNVQTSEGESISTSASISWRHKRFYFGDTSNLITTPSDNTISSIIKSHENSAESELTTSKNKSNIVVNLNNEFFYFIHPAHFGTPNFTINGLANTAFASKTITFTNIFGYQEEFLISRTNNLLTGTFTITTT